jgi:hypothetical protein
MLSKPWLLGDGFEFIIRTYSMCKRLRHIVTKKRIAFRSPLEDWPPHDIASAHEFLCHHRFGGFHAEFCPGW